MPTRLQCCFPIDETIALCRLLNLKLIQLLLLSTPTLHAHREDTHIEAAQQELTCTHKQPIWQRMTRGHKPKQHKQRWVHDQALGNEGQPVQIVHELSVPAPLSPDNHEPGVELCEAVPASEGPKLLVSQGEGQQQERHDVMRQDDVGKAGHCSRAPPEPDKVHNDVDQKDHRHLQQVCNKASLQRAA